MFVRHAFLLFYFFYAYQCRTNTTSLTDIDSANTNETTLDPLQYVTFYSITPDKKKVPINDIHQINTTRPTKILVHGLGGYTDQVWIDQMAYIYHTKGPYNIISVDWSMISIRDTWYVVSMVDSVGNVVGDFIMDITDVDVDYLSDIHLIGSSMGAQISGAAGRKVKNETGKKVGRITGLDPTVPEDLKMLDSEDAEFVDAIHTTVVAEDVQVGTVDFFLTGKNYTTVVCPKNDSCEGPRAEDFYLLTLEDSTRFEGLSCKNVSDLFMDPDLCNKAYMGDSVSQNVTGSYLVQTSATTLTYSKWDSLLATTLGMVLWYIIV